MKIWFELDATNRAALFESLEREYSIAVDRLEFVPLGEVACSQAMRGQGIRVPVGCQPSTLQVHPAALAHSYTDQVAFLCPASARAIDHITKNGKADLF